MKFIKKITLIALSLLVFCYTTFAISTSNNINRDISIIGKAKQVILADLKTDTSKAIAGKLDTTRNNELTGDFRYDNLFK
jgi:hypothetical protein